MATEVNLAQVFRNRAVQYGDKPRWRALGSGAQPQMTWRENQRLVNALLAGLDALGARPGDMIGILSGTRWEWMAADWAIIGLGATCVTLYPSNTPAVCEFILNDSGVCYLFAEDEGQYQKLLGIRAQIPNVRKVILFQDAERHAGDDWVLGFDALQRLSTLSPEQADALAAQRAETIRPEDRFTLVYTSGTTGMPKGVVHTHATFMAQLLGVAESLSAIQADLSHVLFLPLAHIFGRLEHIHGYNRGTITDVCTSFDRLAEDIRTAHPDMLFSVPRVYEKAYAAITGRVEKGSKAQRRIFGWAGRTGAQAAHRMERGQRIPLGLRTRYRLADRLVFHKVREALGGNLKFCVTAAAPLDMKILEFFNAAGVLLLEGWGMTETGGGFTVNSTEHYRMGTVGRVFPGNELKIAEDGEILVRGPCIFVGYHNNPQANADTFEPDGWFHTGDIGELDADGYLRIVDRKKDLIITAAGKNIGPQGVENVLKQMPLISQACVYGDRRPYLVAALTLDPAQAAAWATANGIAYASMAELAANPRLRALMDEQVAAANAKLASYETVKYYAILPEDFTVENELLTPTLKIRRRQINRRYGDLFEGLYRPTKSEASVSGM
ncbi:MAG TPA: long-chain fatty acid--CoA ligase [Ktedonobacterales bacterium]|nr:long-chain fatty acid--CoA ligase [Ktedonobacterales bacterium]